MRRADAWGTVLSTVAVVEAAIATVILLGLTVGVPAANLSSDYAEDLATAGLLMLPILLLATLATVRHLHLVQREMQVRSQVIRATEATVSEWVWQTDADLVLVHCGPRVEQLLGHRPESLVGTRLPDLVSRDDAPALRLAAAASTQNDQLWADVPGQWFDADGSLVQLLSSATKICDKAGRTIGFQGICRTGSFVDEDLRELAATRLRVDHLIADRSLQIALQPIVNVSAGLMSGVEALSRMPDNAPPDVWFQQAHQVGRGVELELLAIETAVARLPELPTPLYISINASPATILDDRFTSLMRRLDRDMERVVLEITEHTPVTSYDDLADAMRPLRELGLRLAVDDAGAGYSSFSHVLRLRPDVIKLDRSLVRDVETDPARRSLVTAIVVLALELEATIIAEGVETATQAEVLNCLGVDGMQGYLLARPSAEPSAIAVWARRDWAVHTGRTTAAGRVPGGRESAAIPTPVEATLITVS